MNLQKARQWRRQLRPRALRRAASAARSLLWSPTLLRLLLEELYTDDSVEQLLGKRLEALPKRRYAEAVAAALHHPPQLAA